MRRTISVIALAVFSASLGAGPVLGLATMNPPLISERAADDARHWVLLGLGISTLVLTYTLPRERIRHLWRQLILKKQS